MSLSDSYYRIKARAEVFRALRQDALDLKLDALAICYGWSAIRIADEALAVPRHDIETARREREP